MNSSPQIIIGLGNPGSKYAGNRHNVGFMALDVIADKYGFKKEVTKFGGLLAEGSIDDKKCYLFKPQSFMNLSGEPAIRLVQFYKIPTANITVFHDELDLPHAKIRVKRGGGNGGHNGLKSLDAHLGLDYQRVRIGIGHPGDKDRVSDYVLSDFSKDEEKSTHALLKEIASHLPLLLQGDDAGFMSKLALNKPKT